MKADDYLSRSFRPEDYRHVDERAKLRADGEKTFAPARPSEICPLALN